MRRALMLLSLVCLLGVAAPAQEPPPGGPPQAGAERPGARDQQPRIRPYDQVITKEAKSDEGVFTVHRIKERVFYEIPTSAYGREFLWVSQIAKTTLGVGLGGQALNNRVVKWERLGDRILLRNVDYQLVADPSEPIARAVAAAKNDTILMAFNIEALGKNDAAVIDVTRLFTSEVAEFSARARLRARGFDTSRSFVEDVLSFPENIEVRTTHTYTAPIDPPQGGQGPQPTGPFGQTGMRPGSASVLMHYSMVKLPEKPMMPRLFDERVGYFSVRQMDYGRPEHRAKERRYITRYRLEKKDPSAELSEPVKPIVYWVDPATPKKWVPYVKRGVDKWQAAFEQAGFKNAIVARDAPSPEQDPGWHPEDARYSVIRWLPSATENAVGPHIHDPRTGEILEADVQMFHNVMNLLRGWYFVQAGPLDPRAQKLPLPDDLMGELIEFVVAHEVGHTLGFQHNMKASSMYPADKIRDAEWLKKMGHVATLMDYSRFNYVAQPEDKLDPALLIPGIGPYDRWATMWGYKPVPGARTPDEEKKTLDGWARQQDDTPWFRFSTAGSQGSDPGELTEAVGDADAVASTTLGLKNIERVTAMLLPATSTQPGEAYAELAELYGRTLGQWSTELNHVAAIVGGYNSQQKHIGQDGVRFTLLPRQKQTSAVKFLNERAFATPGMFLQPDILRRIEPAGALERIRLAQVRVLNSLLSNARLARMFEQEALDGASAYRPLELITDVRRGIWSELDAPAPKVDAVRRNLQRSYISLLSDKLNSRTPVTDDTRALVRGELRSLQAAISAAMGKTADRFTRFHLEDARDQIARALDPKFLPPAPAGPQASPFGADDDPSVEPLTCWPDYSIRLPQD